MRVAPYARTALAVLLATLLLSLLAEVVLRIAGTLGDDGDAARNAKIHFTGDPDLLWELDPEDPLVNADGFRDRIYAREKPPDTVRVVALGDSITYGQSLPLEASFPKQLEARLREDDAGGLRYEVLNLGVGGYNTRQELALLERRGLRYGPDLVVVGYSLNDVLDASSLLRAIGDARAVEEEASGLRRSRLARFVLDRVRRVEAPGARRPPRYFAGLYGRDENWSIVADGFAGFGRVVRERNLPVLVVVFPYLDDLEHYRYGPLHRKVSEAARRNGLFVLDLYPAYRPHGAAALRLSRTDTHPNARGHALAAEAIHAWIRSRGTPPASAGAG